MSKPIGSRAGRVIRVVGLVALVLTFLVPAARAAAEKKTFTADFDSAPDPILAGNTAPITLTIANTSTTQQFGSSNITAPSGHTITSVLSVPSGASATIASPTAVFLRNVAIPAGGQATFSFNVKTPCSAGSYTWTLDGKQANNHQGNPGNDLQLDVANSDLTTTVSGQCQLGFGFTRQPADAEKSPTVITSVARDPSGLPVQVEVRSADGTEGVPLPGVSVVLSVNTDPCGKTPLTVGGSTATTNSSGLAAFPSLTLNQSCLGYTLKATDPSGAVTVGVSAVFNIFDDIGKCGAGQSCSASVPGKASLTAAAGSAGYAQIALSAESVIDCPNYDEVATTMVTFGSTTGGMNTVTILLDTTRGMGTLRVCYASDTLIWRDRNGVLIGDDEPLGTASLLPACPKTPALTDIPCQMAPKKEGGLVAVTFLSPTGATRGRS